MCTIRGVSTTRKKCHFKINASSVTLVIEWTNSENCTSNGEAWFGVDERSKCDERAVTSDSERGEEFLLNAFLIDDLGLIAELFRSRSCAPSVTDFDSLITLRGQNGIIMIIQWRFPVTFCNHPVERRRNAVLPFPSDRRPSHPRRHLFATRCKSNIAGNNNTPSVWPYGPVLGIIANGPCSEPCRRQVFQLQ